MRDNLPLLMGEELSYYQRIRISRPFFLFMALLSLGGFVFCSAEVILSTMGRTLCHSETCQIVENFSRLSRPLMAILAALFFLVQSLGALALWRSRTAYLPFLVFLASMGLGVEAILLTRQFLDYHIHCPFCLIVAGLVFLSAVPILLVCKRFAVFGVLLGLLLASFLAPLPIVPLSQAAVKHVYRGSPTETLFLIYSEDCPHCHEVLSYCETMEDLDLFLCPKEKTWPFLRMLGISGVPVMVVNHNGEKQILVGSGLILSYLKKEQKEGLSDFDEFSVPSGICEENRQCEPLPDIP